MASGATETRADWTEAARELISTHIQSTLGQRDIDLFTLETLDDAREVQIARLHGVVGQAILTHLYTPGFELPNKGDALDLSLGPGANIIQQRHGADYALFVYVRDSYTSAGRALMMVGAAMFGVGLTGGQQIGFASLVDLKTGDIVWFNRIASATGDLRTAEPARATVDDLIEGLPL